MCIIVVLLFTFCDYFIELSICVFVLCGSCVAIYICVTIFIELSICVFVLCVSYMVVYGILHVSYLYIFLSSKYIH